MKIMKGRSESKGCKGFTLIELLIVIAIIALLAAILFPVFARVRENARRTACQSNLKQIGLGMMQYVQDYDETIPAWLQYDYNTTTGVPGTAISIAERLQPYVKNVDIFICPSQSKNTSINTVHNYKSTYCPNVANGNPYGVGNSKGLFALSTNGNPAFTYSSGTRISDVPVPAETIAFAEYDSNDLLDPYAGWSVGRLYAGHLSMSNYLLADGHVKAMAPDATISSRNMWTRADDAFSAETSGNQTQMKAFVAAAKTEYP